MELEKRFKYSLNEDYNSTCDFIEFKHDNIIAKIPVRFTQSSWARHVAVVEMATNHAIEYIKYWHKLSSFGEKNI